MRALPLLLFLVLSAVLAFALVAPRPEKSQTVQQKITPLPPLTIASLDGKNIWSNERLHGQVTLINVFASWCAPCAKEMPELIALRKAFPQLRLEGFAWNDTPVTIKPWLKQYGDPFHHHWLDKDGSATIALGLTGIPETLLVDAQGNIRYRHRGEVTEALRIGAFGDHVKALLEEARHAQ